MAKISDGYIVVDSSTGQIIMKVGNLEKAREESRKHYYKTKHSCYIYENVLVDIIGG